MVTRRASYPTASDLFCGAGGSSHGAEQAGVEIVVAANHWPRACETYGLNHGVQPDCADVSQGQPKSISTVNGTGLSGRLPEAHWVWNQSASPPKRTSMRSSICEWRRPEISGSVTCCFVDQERTDAPSIELVAKADAEVERRAEGS